MTGKTLGISNARTAVSGRVEADTNLSKAQMDPMVEWAQGWLPHDQLYVWNASINGVIVQLQTNNFHLMDFWVDNWFPTPLGEEVQPHGIIYAVTGVPDRQPYAYYCSPTHTAVLINTDYYGQCKSWALGMVADFMEMQRSIHSIHGALVDIGGCGIAIISPTGTGKSTQAYGLALAVPHARIHSDDWFYVLYQGGKKQGRATAFLSERQFYVRTDIAATYPRLGELFSRCKLENVGDSFTQVPNSRAMLDPRWLGGEDNFVRVTRVRAVVLLRRDDHSSPHLRLEPETAIEILEKGEYTIQPGAGPRQQWGQTKYEPFYNPYLLVRNEERTRLQEEFFRQLFSVAQVHILNTGVMNIEETHYRILEIGQICTARLCE